MSEINLVDVLQAAIEYNIANLHTSIPGFVTNINPVAGTVDVQPSIKKLFSNNVTKNLPIIRDVPLVYPCSSTNGLVFKINKGDGVLLVFSERSIENWKQGDTLEKPSSIRKHDISDAFAIPCIFPKKQRANKKNFNPKDGTVLNGNKLFIGDTSATKVGATMMVNVDLVAILNGTLNFLLQVFPPTSAPPTPAGATAIQDSTGTVCTATTLIPFAKDLQEYQKALQKLILEPGN